ncbi:MAG: hypothetical protein GY934_02850, partial [Gammaproteobacteria bacterium]|nr:hypothetical protein [Gammaproteobacteria bacterium]
MFYIPTLEEAYTSIQYLYKDLASWSWLRDMHRWIALFFFVAIVVHAVRSLLRKEFLHQKKKMRWLTGALLLLPMFLFLVTGLILPWDWKGYWFMEMVPNYLGTIPLIGPSLKEFLINAFTLPRSMVAHILILPIVSIILIDLHCFTQLRKKGIFRYLAKHTLIVIPLFIALIALVIYLPMPTEDPEIIPLPLEGVNIPAPEWFILILLLPFMYFKGTMAPLLGLFLPLVIFLALAFLPYYLNRKKPREESPDARGKDANIGNKPAAKSKFARMVGAFVLVVVTSGLLLGGISWGTYKSPTMGCSSCHNLYLGNRMGAPPKTFKDRKNLPLLDDNEWMMRHWFNPQIVW